MIVGADLELARREIKAQELNFLNLVAAMKALVGLMCRL